MWKGDRPYSESEPTVNAMPAPIEGKLAPFIAEVTNNLLQEINSVQSEEPTFSEKIEMLQKSPILGTAADVTTLLAVQSFGKYEHPDPEIREWVLSNLANMTGSFKQAIGEQVSAKFLKYAVSEWSVREEANEWLLDAIAILHPSYYTFRVQDRKLFDILERSGVGDVYIPMDRLIVTINSPHLTFGNPSKAPSDCKRADTLYKAWKLVMSEMLVAAQRQAVPIVVGQTNPDSRVILYSKDGVTPLRDEDGRPVTISATQDLLNQLVELDNRAVISTDLEAKIFALSHQTDGRFFVEILNILERLQLLAFLFPETIFSVGEGGLGNAGLNAGHMTILDMGIDGVTDQIREQMIEKPIRSLITWNFGEQETYGHFQREEEETGDRVALLQAISSAVFQGSFSAADEAVINRMRDLAGIPRTSEMQFARQGTLDVTPNGYWRGAA